MIFRFSTVFFSYSLSVIWLLRKYRKCVLGFENHQMTLRDYENKSTLKIGKSEKISLFWYFFNSFDFSRILGFENHQMTLRDYGNKNMLKIEKSKNFHFFEDFFSKSQKFWFFSYFSVFLDFPGFGATLAEKCSIAELRQSWANCRSANLPAIYPPTTLNTRKRTWRASGDVHSKSSFPPPNAVFYTTQLVKSSVEPVIITRKGDGSALDQKLLDQDKKMRLLREHSHFRGSSAWS